MKESWTPALGKCLAEENSGKSLRVGRWESAQRNISPGNRQNPRVRGGEGGPMNSAGCETGTQACLACHPKNRDPAAA